jgi:hypothetical protein
MSLAFYVSPGSILYLTLTMDFACRLSSPLRVLLYLVCKVRATFPHLDSDVLTPSLKYRLSRHSPVYT